MLTLVTVKGSGNMKISNIGWVAFVLVVVGAVNWGLVGVFDYNLVAHIFGQGSVVSKIIYGLVGVSGLYMIFEVFKK